MSERRKVDQSTSTDNRAKQGIARQRAIALDGCINAHNEVAQVRSDYSPSKRVARRTPYYRPRTTDHGPRTIFRSAFTLTELLVVIMIIVLLASIVLFAMAGVQQEARKKRTRAQIARLNELLMEQWQSYQTRRVPLRTVQNNPRLAAEQRLHAIRELMRMELPDRRSDCLEGPGAKLGMSPPSRWLSYRRRVESRWGSQWHTVTPPNAVPPTTWTPEHEGAECLYMIVSRIQVGNSNGLEFFSESEIGDVDRDGMPEILDGWGTPIRLLRWPAGFRSPLQDGNPASGRDTFDPTGLFPENYTIYPLVVSAGPDRQFDMKFTAEDGISYSAVDNNPYAGFGSDGLPLGVVVDANNDGEDNSLDNIHNHMMTVN